MPGNFIGELKTIKSDRADLKKSQREILQIKDTNSKTIQIMVLDRHAELSVSDAGQTLVPS